MQFGRYQVSFGSIVAAASIAGGWVVSHQVGIAKCAADLSLPAQIMTYIGGAITTVGFIAAVFSESPKKVAP